MFQRPCEFGDLSLSYFQSAQGNGEIPAVVRLEIFGSMQDLQTRHRIAISRAVWGVKLDDH